MFRFITKKICSLRQKVHGGRKKGGRSTNKEQTRARNEQHDRDRPLFVAASVATLITFPTVFINYFKQRRDDAVKADSRNRRKLHEDKVESSLKRMEKNGEEVNKKLDGLKADKGKKKKDL